jgi:hypothetical protein
MKPWYEGRPETKQIVVIPPLGQERAFAAVRERLSVHLQRLFPDLEFEFADSGFYEEASVIPLCGTVGDGETGGLLAPPPEETLREIERALNAFDLAALKLN